MRKIILSFVLSAISIARLEFRVLSSHEDKYTSLGRCLQVNRAFTHACSAEEGRIDRRKRGIEFPKEAWEQAHMVVTYPPLTVDKPEREQILRLGHNFTVCV